MKNTDYESYHAEQALGMDLNMFGISICVFCRLLNFDGDISY